jgi:hypothetical protein
MKKEPYRKVRKDDERIGRDVLSLDPKRLTE